MPSDDPVPRSGAGYGGQTGTSGLPGPLRRFADRLDDLRSADVVDMDLVGRLLVELAADEELFDPLIAQLPSGSPGNRWLIRPERGPRLVLVHRPEGVMGYTHSHRCWVGIAPVRGVETHQKWDAVRHAGGRAELRLADERALVHGEVATLVPPRDVHNHGHVAGSGPSLWMPETLSPHATWAYSWIRPPSRSRLRTRTFEPRADGCGRPAGSDPASNASHARSGHVNRE
jgi:predicted metal-dependent enzyme (double-stranded beta helix superfamily)